MDQLRNNLAISILFAMVGCFESPPSSISTSTSMLKSQPTDIVVQSQDQVQKVQGQEDSVDDPPPLNSEEVDRGSSGSQNVDSQSSESANALSDKPASASESQPQDLNGTAPNPLAAEVKQPTDTAPTPLAAEVKQPTEDDSFVEPVGTAPTPLAAEVKQPTEDVSFVEPVYIAPPEETDLNSCKGIYENSPNKPAGVYVIPDPSTPGQKISIFCLPDPDGVWTLVWAATEQVNTPKGAFSALFAESSSAYKLPNAAFPANTQTGFGLDTDVGYHVNYEYKGGSIEITPVRGFDKAGNELNFHIHFSQNTLPTMDPDDGYLLQGKIYALQNAFVLDSTPGHGYEWAFANNFEPKPNQKGAAYGGKSLAGQADNNVWTVWVR